MAQKFDLGQVLATKGVCEIINQKDMQGAIFRHSSGDWGELCDEDKEANELALKHGDRILSSYSNDEGVAFWIITEHDRSVTTLLLPEEY